MASTVSSLQKAEASRKVSEKVESTPAEVTVGGAMRLGMFITTLAFLPGGLLIGYFRSPGSTFTTNFSSFIWPLINTTALGLFVGASLGYIFGSITVATAHHGDKRDTPKH